MTTKRTNTDEHAKKAPISDDEMGEFEDMFEDELSEEEELGSQSEDSEEEMEEKLIYLPGDAMEQDEELVADLSTYDMLHQMNCEWPCLSFDILSDSLGNRSTYPMTSYFVAGSQAESSKDNKIYVMKLSSLYKTKVSEDSDEESDGDDDLDEDPILEYKAIPHFGGVNRIRVMPSTTHRWAATLSDTSKLHIHDISSHLAALDTPGLVPSSNSPLYTFEHTKEGYALDWSTLNPGSLLSGDTAKMIYLTTGTSTGFDTDSKPFVGHTGSVEDVQWSPSQASVFASCSSDGSVRIWDARDASKSPKLSVKVHDCDVNVISWNRSVDFLLASGSESGQFSIWDLRNWSGHTLESTPMPAATFKWHKKPITSIQWNPHESSVLAVSGADDQLTLWDLALERDQEEETVSIGGGTEVPPQLLFIHQGQSHIKEISWHKQIPGVIMSTAYDGFNIFKTINS